MRSILEEEVSVELEPIQLQHVNVKLLLKDTGDLNLDPAIPVFHGWIQDQVFDELLLDVADYRHVLAGPGVVLIGHEADYSVDNTDGRWGIRYNRKAVVEGNNQDRLEQAIRAALQAAQRLEADTRLDRRLCFNGREIEVFINDRLLAPNREETHKIIEPDFQAFFDRLFARSGYSLSYASDPGNDRRRLFGAFIRAAQPFSVDDLLDNLGSSKHFG